MISHARIALLAAALMGGCATPASDDRLSELVARHTAAVGGAPAIEATQSVEYRIDIAEPTFQVSGVYVADRSGRMRIDVYAGGKRVYTEAYDGKGAWQMNDDGQARPSAASGAAALWHGTQIPGKLLGLHEMARHGHRLELIGDETLDGQLFHVLKLTFSDKFVTYLYIDAASLLIARQRDERALHPDVDPAKKQLENRFDEYRPLDGVQRSFSGRQIDIQTGAILQTTRVTLLRVNVPLGDDTFRVGSLPPIN
jgi:hypothetical protein